MSYIYIISGTTIGIVLGVIFSYIGLRAVYGYNSMLTIQMPSIICSFIVSIISVAFSSFIVIKKYKNFKLEIGTIMKESYSAGQDGNTQGDGAQVIFREDDYKELTNQKEYNKLFVTVEKGHLYSVEKRLKELTKNHSSTEINGKGEELKVIGGQQSSEENLSVIYKTLTLLIISLNIIFIMRSNII